MEGREKELGPYFILRWAHWILKFCCIAAHCITVQTQERVQHTALHDSTVRTRYLHGIRHLALYNIIRHFGVHVKLFLSTDTYSKTSFWKKATTFQRCTDTNHTKDPAPSRKKMYVIATNDIRHTHTHNEENVYKITNICMYIYCIFCTYRLWTSASVSLKKTWVMNQTTTYCRWNRKKPTHMCFFFRGPFCQGYVYPKVLWKSITCWRKKRTIHPKWYLYFFIVYFIMNNHDICWIISQENAYTYMLYQII